MSQPATRPNEATTALLYAGLFCLTHVVTSILLGALLQFLLVKFGVLGFPGAHLLVIVAVTAFIALTFAKRRHRLFTPKEFWVLFSVSALYLLVLDGVLAASYVTAVGIGGYLTSIGALLSILDLAVLYVSLQFLGRRLVARYLAHQKVDRA
jgi:hypothetical protein